MTEQEVREKLAAFARSAVAGGEIMLATVKDVDKNECTCTLSDDGVDYFSVRLRPVSGGNSGLVLFPKSNAFALATAIEGGDMVLLMASEYESIELKIDSQSLKIDDGGFVFNGGSLDGMVKINELTQKLNALVQIFNSHTHTVTTTGSASAQSGMAAPTASTAQAFKKSDYEDTKIKH
jgi:hypothetical protein